MQKKYLIYSLVFILITFTGCKTKNSQEQEVQKLLDRQVTLKDQQKESVEMIQQIKDSLSLEKKFLIDERDQKDQQFETLKQNQQVLVDKLNNKAQSEVTTERAELEKKITAYEDSIALIKTTLNSLGSDIDSIEKNMDFYEQQEGQAEEVMKAGIGEIDQRISKLEARKRQYIDRAEILKKRISIYNKKIEAYDMERTLYINERDKLIRENTSDENIKPYLDKISSLDSTIQEEKENKHLLIDEVAQIDQWIKDVDKIIVDLGSKINNKYERKKIVESYIDSEKERLDKELNDLTTTHENMLKEEELISRERSRIEREIFLLDRRMELIKSREMSDILDLQSEIEQSDASLADQEIQNLQAGPPLGERYTNDTASQPEHAELKNIMDLGDQLDSLKASIEDEKAEIVKTRRELADRRAEAARKRASFGRTTGALFLIIIIGSIGVISLFYYLGKKARKSNS